MSDCIDKKFQARLHSYEMGMLSDEERLEFEAHLVECDHCAAELQEMQSVTKLMLHDNDVRAQVTDIANESESAAERSSSAGWWRRWLPRTALAAAVLIVLILSDWKFEIGPSDEVQATENRLVVLYFENLADPDDPDRLAEIATHLVISDLAGSQYLEVVSSQRLKDVAAQVTGEIGIARKTGSRWMLTGSLLQVEPSIELTTQLVDVESGEAIKSQKISGELGEDLFALVDRLTPLVKSDLELPEAAAAESDLQVAKVTTSSTESYRLYLDGMDWIGKYDLKKASANFRRAIELDSTFAMAYYCLASYDSTGFIDQAIKWSENVHPRERLYIQALKALIDGDSPKRKELLEQIVAEYPDEKDALLRLSQIAYFGAEYDRSIDYLHTVLELDPSYKDAYNMMAYSYSKGGDYEKSLWAINKYIDMVPDEPNPYDSRGDLHSFAGQTENARESYRRALEIRSDYYYSLEKLGHMYSFEGNYEAADSCYDLLLSWDRATTRSYARYYKAYIPLRKGQLSVALETLERGIEEDKAESQQTKWLAQKYIIRAMILAEKQQWQAALTQLDSCEEVGADFHSYQDIDCGSAYAIILARSGRVDEARAKLAALREAGKATNQSEAPHLVTEGLIELYAGNYETSIDLLERRREMAPYDRNPLLNIGLGRAYLESGRLSEAVELLEWQIMYTVCARLFHGLENIKMHFYLGRAYEESRWYDKAAEQYRVFIDTWKDADHGFPELADARERLKRLQELP